MAEVAEVKDPQGNIVVPHSDGVAIEWGAFVTVVIDFIIVAFVIFLIIKGLNSPKKKAEETPAAPPPPSATEELLREIRDELRNRK